MLPKFSVCCATLLLTSVLAPLAAFAQTSAPTPTSVPPDARTSQGAALYLALGERAGISLLTDDFVKRLKLDARLASAFKDSNDKNLSLMLSQQFCKLSGGPCAYEGGDMKSVHSNMDITKTDFNALVEVLQAAMDARGIAFGTQNQLLALLAPMHRDLITVK